MASEDPFCVLALDEDATHAKVESAFRKLALRCHPDRHPKDPLAKSRFLRISRAKEILLDPTKRREALNQRHARLSKQRKTQETRKSDDEEGTRQAAAKQQAAEKRKKQRDMEAERLKKKEAEAKQRKRRAQEEAKRKREKALVEEAKRRRTIAEEAARERAAEQLRMKAAVLDTFLDRKRSKDAKDGSVGAQPALTALVENFARSSERTLEIAGPLNEATKVELIAAAATHALIVVREGVSFRLSRICDRSDNAEFPHHGPRSHARSSCSRKQMDRGATERHRQALERLQVRRQCGEGLNPTALGSWWVHDEEAERWSKDIERYGF